MTSQSWIFCSLGPGVSFSFCCGTFCFQNMVRSTRIIFSGNGCKKFLTPDRILLQKWQSTDSETLTPEWSRQLFHAADWYLGWNYVTGESTVSFCLSLCDVDCCGVYGMRLSFIHLILLYVMLPNIGVTWGGASIYFYLRIVFFTTELKRSK